MRYNSSIIIHASYIANYNKLGLLRNTGTFIIYNILIVIILNNDYHDCIFVGKLKYISNQTINNYSYNNIIIEQCVVCLGEATYVHIHCLELIQGIFLKIIR